MSNRRSFRTVSLWAMLLLVLVSCTDGPRLALLKRKSVQVLRLPSPVVPEWEEDLLPEDFEAYQQSLQSFAAALTAIDPLSLSPAQTQTYVELNSALEETIQRTASLRDNPARYNLPGRWKALLSNPELSNREIGELLKKQLPEAGPYYQRARQKLTAPTKAHCRLALEKHILGMAFAGTELQAAVIRSELQESEKARLQKDLHAARLAIKEYIGWCNSQMIQSPER
ncbi:MAG: hypothetical protein KBG02_02645 [Haliscomenobacter sp.]|nr:hypothetical protein [Haliscomenobacter sp.]MBP9075732.1 hypothetical protein [Haliscomenobacter sp.]